MAIVLSADTRLVIADSIVSRPVDGSTVLLDVNSGRTFCLDEVGTSTWTALIETPTVFAAVSRLAGEYDAPIDEIAADVAALVQSLADKCLVSVRSN